MGFFCGGGKQRWFADHGSKLLCGWCVVNLNDTSVGTTSYWKLRVIKQKTYTLHNNKEMHSEKKEKKKIKIKLAEWNLNLISS